MDTDSNKDNTKALSTSDVLSVICFVFTAYCILKLFQPSQDARMSEPSPAGPAIGSQETFRTSEVGRDEQYENAEKGGEDSEEEKDGMRRNEWEKSFDVEGGRTDIISLGESDGSGASGLSGEEEEDGGQREDEDEHSNWDGDEEKDQEEEAEAKPRSSKERGRIHTAYTAPENPAPPKKQSEVKQARKPTAALRQYNDDFYPLYDPVAQNQGTGWYGRFRHYNQYWDCPLYINPYLKESELDRIPHHGVRLDDLTASKVLRHFDRKTLHARWPTEFDLKGMIRATRVPLGRAAKRWVYDGERDVEGRLVEEEGWYYLSWRGIHTFMGKEGLDADRYWVRPKDESFKCDGFDFKREDWAEVQLASEDPKDPTFL